MPPPRLIWKQMLRRTRTHGMQRTSVTMQKRLLKTKTTTTRMMIQTARPHLSSPKTAMHALDISGVPHVSGACAHGSPPVTTRYHPCTKTRARARARALPRHPPRAPRQPATPPRATHGVHQRDSACARGNLPVQMMTFHRRYQLRPPLHHQPRPPLRHHPHRARPRRDTSGARPRRPVYVHGSRLVRMRAMTERRASIARPPPLLRRHAALPRMMYRRK